MRLDGKNVVITGAGSGIGRAACGVFAAAGAKVIGVDVDRDAVDASVSSVRGTAVVGSVADPALWDEVLRVAEAAGGLDVAYLNAGLYGWNGPIDELPLELYQRTIDANIGGVVLGTRAVVPALRARGGGAIVVTASVAGIVAFAPNPVYTLTKQAVTGFVQAVAPGLAADGISIDAVCPGVVDTPMTSFAMGGGNPKDLGIALIAPETIAATALALAATEGTGRCRAVRERGEPVDWRFPTFADLAHASAPTPKEVVERFLRDGMRDGEWDMAVIDECFDEKYFSHTWQGDLAHTGARQGRWFGAFEFLDSLDDHVVAEGDLVVHHSRRRVRHVGDALGVAATGRELEVDHVEMWRVRGGNIVEHWGGMGVAGQLHRALTS